MIIKELLENQQETKLINKSIEYTVPEEFKGQPLNRTVKRQMKKSLKKKYSKVLKEILSLELVESDHQFCVHLLDIEIPYAFIEEEKEINLKEMDWKVIISSSITCNKNEENDVAASILRYMTWEHMKYSDFTKSKEEMTKEYIKGKEVMAIEENN